MGYEQFLETHCDAGSKATSECPDLEMLDETYATRVLQGG